MIDPDTQEKQFIEAHDQYSQALFRHCYYRVFDKEKAKDFVQEAFCRTWKYITQGNEIENLRAFLYRTVSNIIIDESRKKKQVSLDAIMEKGFAPKADQRELNEAHFANKEAMEIINGLDKKYKEVIIFKYVDGFSAREIARMVNKTENNVHVLLHRGLEQVRHIIQEKENRPFV